jgi:hypothetical protein
MLPYPIAEEQMPSAQVSVFAAPQDRIVHSPRIQRRKLILRQARKFYAKIVNERRRYIHCIPRGGLNDMLCQIQLCIDYAARFGAVVVINGTRSGFRDQFGRYFSTLVPDPFLVLSDYYLSKKMLGNEDCIPTALRERAYSYEPVYIEHNNFCDSLTGTRLTFDMQIGHSAQLLIHEQCGGGSYGWKVLNRLKLTPRIREEVLKRIQHLPTDYVCVHIRNSDVSTDYKKLIDLVATHLIDENVVICTDSCDALAYARLKLIHSKIINLAQLPNLASGVPLHDRPGSTDISTNIGLLADLIAISLARKLFVANPPLGYPSGFATLGRSLMQHPQIVCNLLGCIPSQLTSSHVD